MRATTKYVTVCRWRKDDVLLTLKTCRRVGRVRVCHIQQEEAVICQIVISGQQSTINNTDQFQAKG
jgi:hypothetical protein